eukprot:9419966-Pyramimonas_sp.AAC.1
MQPARATALMGAAAVPLLDVDSVAEQYASTIINSSTIGSREHDPQRANQERPNRGCLGARRTNAHFALRRRRRRR